MLTIEPTTKGARINGLRRLDSATKNRPERKFIKSREDNSNELEVKTDKLLEHRAKQAKFVRSKAKGNDSLTN